MNREDPAGMGRPGGEDLLALVRDLRALREKELRLLEKLEEALRTAAPLPARDDGPAPESSTERVVPDWIDSVVDQALRGAFSGESTDPDDEDLADEPGRTESASRIDFAPESGPSGVEPVSRGSAGLSAGAAAGGDAGSATATNAPGGSEPPLLLLGDGETWVGTPWESIREVGLAEPAGAGASRWSLSDLVAGARRAPSEPYRVSWGEAELTCAQIGGILGVSAAAERGVEAVLCPDPGGAGRPRLVSLIDFLREARTRVPEPLEVPAPEVHKPEAPAQEPEALPTPEPQALPTPEPEALPTEPEASPMPEFVAPPEPFVAPEPVVAPEPAVVEVPVPEQSLPLHDLPELPGPVHEMDEFPELSDLPELSVTTPDRPVAVAPGPALRRDAFIAHSALLAIRYLPARVAIGRVLRARGWTVAESVDFREIPLHLHRRRFTIVFAEVPHPAPLSSMTALREAAASGSALVGVGSRLRGGGADPLRALGEVPRLLYPFLENDLDKVLLSARTSGVPA